MKNATTPPKADGFLVVTADTTRSELEEAMTHLAHRASRVPWFFPEYSRLHDRINALLGYWQTLGRA